MRVLTCFSAMDHVTRHIDFHVEYDHDNSLLGFYTEREACAGPLWVMLDALPVNVRVLRNIDRSVPINVD